ncbi:hypothetical protein HU200_039028 [Digitaria exilis]|uniref:Uncharacterized protein n=1 Tax=Digitaria exilis TaxID=1010633 RepID=A0A835EK68_9POAL|nr:hypothetical protein HU200_039028 [Digitaria exilis]
MGPAVAGGKPCSSSARRSSSTNARWPRWAIRTTNRLPSTLTATRPAGAAEEETAASARDRHRRRARRRQASDGMVIATLHMIACFAFAFARRSGDRRVVCCLICSGLLPCLQPRLWLWRWEGGDGVAIYI